MKTLIHRVILLLHATLFVTVLQAQTYCTPPSTSCSFLQIINVTIGSINNTSTCTSGGYSDFSSSVPVASLGAGATYMLTVKGNFSVQANAVAWVDYNHDGIFSASEYINLGTQNAVSGQGIFYGALHIPLTATLTTTRMRVRMKYEFNAPAILPDSSCGNIPQGETEDYSLAIGSIPACSASIIGGTVLSSANNICPTNAFTLSVNGSTTGVSGLSYQWQSSPDGSNWTDITGAIDPWLIKTQFTTSFYRRRLSCSAGGTVYSSTVTVTSNAINTCYCVPPASSCGSFQYAGLENIIFSNLSNASDCSVNGYTDYSSNIAAANIQSGTYVNATIKFLAGNMINTKGVALGIDFNHDGVFDYDEITYGSSPTQVVLPVRIPFNALTGNTRMRIRCSTTNTSGPSLCLADNYSETEDYLVNIAAASAPGPAFSFYVNSIATGNGTGLSWANAFTNLMTALNVAKAGDTLRVARGSYAISGYPYTFSLKDSMILLGGYPNSGNPTDAQRNWGTNQTILSGIGVPTIVSAGNKFLLDGFLLQDINSYPNDGGTIRLSASRGGTIRHCVFRNNYCANFSGTGSALKITNSSLLIADCYFVNNRDDGGSVIFAQTNSNVTLQNCVFSGNNSARSTVESNASVISLINCDLVSNSTRNSKTVQASTGSTLNIANTIFHKNLKMILPNQNIVYSLDSSDIELNNSTISINNSITQVYDYGNVSLLAKNPKFIDTSRVAGADNLFFTSDDGYQLLNPCSPAINTGSNTAATGISKDIFGNNRIFASLVDIGAYELQSVLNAIPHTLYVNNLATGNGSGTSWANAMTDLQQALGYCSDTIRMAAGTYTPSNDNDQIAYWLENKRVILGGYPNTGNPTDAQRNPATNPTILSGVLPVGGNVKSDVIITGRGVDSTSIVDGLFIQGAESLVSPTLGAVYLSIFSNPVFRNCNFNNNSSGLGSAVVNFGNSHPRFYNCTFENNSGNYLGAGGGAVGNYQHSNAAYIKCLFKNNKTEIGSTEPYSGGAVYNSDSNPIFDSCVFVNNRANNAGGAVANFNSNPVISNCSFLGNFVSPDYSFGGTAIDIYNEGSSPVVSNSLFSDSTGCNHGGSIANLSNSNPSFTKCEFRNGYALYYGGFIYNDNSSPAFNRCVFTGARANSNGGVIYNQYNSNPVLVNCIAYANRVVSVGAASFIFSSNSNTTVKNTTVSGSGRIIGPPNLYQTPVFVNTGASQLNLSNSILWGNTITPEEIFDDAGTPPSIVKNCITQVFGTSGVNGNLVGYNPLLADTLNIAGADHVFFTNDDGMRITSCSPGVNAGDNNAITGYAIDLAGNTRIFSTVVDMGAYEVQLVPGLVTNTWTGVVNASWENPANWSLGIIPDPCTKVVISSGTILLSSNTTIYNLTINPSASFTVAAGYNLTITN